MWQELIATGFYVGRFRYAPGTLGTLWGVPLAYLFAFKWWTALPFFLLLTYIAYITSEYMVSLTGEKDPEDVVIDEVAGYFCAFLFVEPNLRTLALAFILFRVLDIVKPYPINLLQKLPGGYGVVADDLLAGMITGIVLLLLLS
ncbi:MAG: phosphatidylglycerophosphatase A [Aquificota bacterium]|nr:MAG: phosphatidylglycerophosphatase A [Aquificota bacterium]